MDPRLAEADAAVERPAPPGPAWAWAWLPMGLAALSFALHVGFAHRYGFTNDEYYMVACSQRPALGYVDHPPVAVWLVGAVVQLFGPSLVALRALAAAFGSGTILLAASCAGALGGGPAARALAALAVFTCAGMQAHFDQASLNAPDLFLVALAARVGLWALAAPPGPRWVALGATLGVGVMTKYSMGVVALSLAAGVVLTRARAALGTRWPWLGAGVAIALALPNLAWQLQHDWITWTWIRWMSENFLVRFAPGDLALRLTITLNPVTAPLWAAGLLALVLAPSSRGARTLGVAAWVYLAVFSTRPIRVYYLFPIFTLAFAAGAVALERLATHRVARWALAGYAAVLLGSAAISLPHVIPILSIQDFLEMHHRLGLGVRAQSEARQVIPVQFRGRFGWDDVLARLRDVHQALPPDEQARATLLVQTYATAATVEVLGPSRGLPPMISSSNQYWLWGPGEARGDVVVVMGYWPELLHQLFEEVQPAGVLRADETPNWTFDRPLWVCRRARAPLAQLWHLLWPFGGSPPPRALAAATGRAPGEA